MPRRSSQEEALTEKQQWPPQLASFHPALSRGWAACSPSPYVEHRFPVLKATGSSRYRDLKSLGFSLKVPKESISQFLLTKEPCDGRGSPYLH